MHPNFLHPKIKELIQKQNSEDSSVRDFVSYEQPKYQPVTVDRDRSLGEKIGLALGFAAFVLVVIFGYPAVDAAYRVYKIYPLAKDIKSAVENEQYASLYADSRELHFQLKKFRIDMGALDRLDFIPGLGEKVESLYYTSAGVEKALKVFMPSIEQVSKTNGDFHKITGQQRAAIIKHMAANSKELEQASKLIRAGDLDYGPADVREALHNLDEVAAMSSELPDLLGVNAPARYLLIFANNLEIRPAGGFIGSYGVLTLVNGEIAEFNVHNSYELPGAFNLNAGPIAPPVVQRYLGIRGTPFRDSNWSPDYPTSVQAMREAYIREGGEYNHDIKGVITVSTEMLREVMAITGPVTVDGVTFTEDNVIQELEKQVEISFYFKGVDWFRRKDIMGELGSALQAKMEEFSPEQYRELFSRLTKLSDQRHVVYSFANAKAQAEAAQRGWDGAMPGYKADTLMIVDANLAGFKTEPAMTKLYNYSVAEVDGKLRATLTINYQHRGQLNPLVRNYRTYVRVYVPNGSTLVSSSGNTERIDVSGEQNRTVFGTLMLVPISSQRSLTLVYDLPANIPADNSYELQFIKQIGAYANNLRLNFDFGNVNREIEEVLDESKTFKLK